MFAEGRKGEARWSTHSGNSVTQFHPSPSPTLSNEEEEMCQQKSRRCKNEIQSIRAREVVSFCLHTP